MEGATTTIINTASLRTAVDSGGVPKQDPQTPAICPKCGSPGHDDSIQQLCMKRMLHRCSHCNECFCTVPNAKTESGQMTGFYSIKLKEINPCEKEESHYQCLLCNKMYSTLAGRNTHMAKHTGVDTHMCTQCGFVSNEKPALEAHVVTHREGHAHKCSVCCKVFGTTTEVDQHLSSHLGDELHRCTQCSFMSTVNFDVQAQVMTLTLVQSEATTHAGVVTQNINIRITYSCSSKSNQPASMLEKDDRSHEGESSTVPLHIKSENESEDDYQSCKGESLAAGPDNTEVHSMLSDSEQSDVMLGKNRGNIEGEDSHLGHLNNEVCGILSEKSLLKKKLYMCAECKCVFSKEAAFQTHLLTHKDHIQSVEGGITQPRNLRTRGRGSSKNSRKPMAASTSAAKSCKNHYTKMYKCPYCSEQFGYEALLKKHMASHNRCVLCKGMFSSADELKEHVLTHTTRKELKCTVCNKWFLDLMTHMKTHTANTDGYDIQARTGAASMKDDTAVHVQDKPETGFVSEMGSTESGKPHKCSLCGKGFVKRANLLAHKRTHNREKSFVCTLCGQRCANPLSFRRHMERHTIEKQHECSYCGKNVTTPSSLKEHIATQHGGEKSHLCILCDKQFPSKAYLRKHLKSHSEEKPHACSQCDKRYRTERLLKRHVLVHTDKFQCSYCGKKMCEAVALKQHEMLHTDETPFPCSLCDKRYKTRDRLRNHMVTHTGERPHMCFVCGKTFLSASGLKVHMRTHTGERPYLCSECGKGFTVIGALKAHKLVHTGEKPYSCTVCGRSYSARRQLKKHSCVPKKRGRKKKPDCQELTETVVAVSSIDQPFIPAYMADTSVLTSSQVPNDWATYTKH